MTADSPITEGDAGPALVLGPMLRYVSETEATIWVETDQECQVEILGRQAPTFQVAGHHYGLVVIDGLSPGSEHEYRVTLDGTVRWPLPGSNFPPSVLRTRSSASPDRPVRLAFGSCRVTEIGPWNHLDPAEDVDALAACAAGLRDSPRDRWPDVLLMIGDQVYADEPGPATRRLIASRRAPAAGQPAAGQPAAGAPIREVADFEEYCALYREAWSDPAVRWLFSVVPTAMIFDDHDVHDDWNISAAWRRDYAARPWWGSRIESSYQSYWVYQHLGNLSPSALAGDETWGKIIGQADAAPLLADLAHHADQRAPGVRWSFARTFGKVRLIMLDSRSRRVVDGAKRLMADEAEWRWLTESLSGDWEHVVLATSVPPLLPRGIHALEAWNEKICDGAWGSRAARAGERLRRMFDLEHWPAFGASFAQLEQLLTELAAGQYSPHGEPPVSVTIISGDVHHSYLTAVDLPSQLTGATAASEPPATGPRSAVYEAVCSPFHQAMPPKMRRAQRLASARISGLIGSAVARLAGARAPRIGWQITKGPWFENMLATLEYDARQASIRFDRATVDASGAPRLKATAETRLS